MQSLVTLAPHTLTAEVQHSCHNSPVVFVSQLNYNIAAFPCQVEYKGSEEKKLVTGLTGIDDEVVQEIMD